MRHEFAILRPVLLAIALFLHDYPLKPEVIQAICFVTSLFLEQRLDITSRSCSKNTLKCEDLKPRKNNPDAKVSLT